MDSLIQTFHIDWHLMVAQLINFVVVIIVLWLFALKPLKKLMDERSKTIAGGLDNAKKQEALLAQAAADYEAMMAKANADGMLKIKQAIKDAEAKKVALMEKVDSEIAEKMKAADVQINTKTNQAMEEFKQQAVMLLVAAAEKVLGDTVDKKVDAKLVEESIKQI